MSTVIIRSPAYYARRRFLRNKPAVVSLVMIIAIALVAILGYSIAPDSSTNANNGQPALQKLPPGFKAEFVRLKTSQPTQIPSAWQVWLTGQPAPEEIPIRSFLLSGNEVKLVPLQRPGLPLIPKKVRLDQLQEVESLSNAVQASDIAFREKYIYGRTYWLGTDKAGRDVLSRLILGARVSLTVGFLAVLLSVLIGTAAGAIGGYMGGYTDKVVLWIMTVIWSIPGVILVIAISLALQQKGLLVMVIAVGVTSWVEVGRIVRGEMMALKERTFVEAARALGLPRWRIIIRHLLPNLLAPIIVVATANFASAILMEAGLSFLGLGVQPPTPSWGVMVSEGFQLLGSEAGWYLILVPSLCISALVMAFNLVGNGLRDANDPKTLFN